MFHLMFVVLRGSLVSIPDGIPVVDKHNMRRSSSVFSWSNYLKSFHWLWFALLLARFCCFFSCTSCLNGSCPSISGDLLFTRLMRLWAWKKGIGSSFPFPLSKKSESQMLH